jgi:hypothetical protein
MTPGVNDPGPWQWYVKRPDNRDLSIMEVKRKYMHEQLLFENYISTLNTLNTVSTAAAGAAGGPAPGGGGTPETPEVEILTESGDAILAENGDFLVTE